MGELSMQFMNANPLNVKSTQSRSEETNTGARITKSGRLFGVAADNDKYYLIEAAILDDGRKIISAKEVAEDIRAIKSSAASTGKPFFNIQNLCKIWFGDNPEMWRHDLRLVDEYEGVRYYEVMKNGTEEAVNKFFRENQIKTVNWHDEVLECIKLNNMIRFTLNEIYKYEPVLAKKFPENHTIQSTIRRVLQTLRDEGYLAFVDDNGSYRITPKFLEKLY